MQIPGSWKWPEHGTPTEKAAGGKREASPRERLVGCNQQGLRSAAARLLNSCFTTMCTDAKHRVTGLIVCCSGLQSWFGFILFHSLFLLFEMGMFTLY